MDKFEYKLKSLIDQPIRTPDSDEFIERLHETIHHRQVAKNRIISSASIVIVFVGLTVGLFEYLMKDSESLYWEEAVEFPLFSEIYDMELDNGEWLVDDTFVLEVLDYLIQESDPIVSGLDIWENLDDFGILEDLKTKHMEG